MIQRIQSIYLSLVFILGILCFFIPYILFYSGGNFVGEINTTGVVFSQNAIITASLNTIVILTINIALICLLTMVTIFLFKKRSWQTKLIKINMGFVIISIVLMYLFADIIKTAINAEIQYYYASAFPILSLIFLYLSLKAVNKDEELVKAADRLR